MKTVQFQIAVTLDEATIGSLVEMLAPAIMRAVGVSAPQAVENRDARLRASQKSIFGGQEPLQDQGLLIDSREAMKLLKVSRKTLYTMQTTGKMPPPIRIGAAVRWSLDVLKKWVEAGCPACQRPPADASGNRQ